jgi:molybdate transport system substrate-binding protein
MKKKQRRIALFLSLLLAFGLGLPGCGSTGEDNPGTSAQADQTLPPETGEPVALLVYAGAGLKTAMEAVKAAYEAEHNVLIEYVYAGSTQLLSQIELSGKGDVFVVGSEKAYETAVEKGYAAAEYELIAHHTPCIAVQAGNPKGISSLEDLAQEGIRVILGDPEANAIGQTAQKIIEKTGLTGINDNVVSQTSTVNEIVTQIAMGQADAGIVTLDSIHSNTDIEIIEIPDDQNIDQIIPAGTLTASQNLDAAQSFVSFLASDAGKQIFEENGFPAVG